MAKLIGTVTHVVGEVFAVSANGTRRALFEGDKLFAGEHLQTGAAGAVAVHLADGGELTLGRDSSMPLTTEILANHATHVDTPDVKGPTQAQLADVEQIQKAIAAGDDPTKTADPTAAGPAVNGKPGALGGGHSFVLLSEVGGHVDPVIGFPTAGFNTPVIVPEGQNAPITASPDNTPPDTSITLSGLDKGGERTVFEANLADGSATNLAALTQSGHFTINTVDGLQSLSVGGVSVISGGVPSGFPQTITTSLGNTLTITGYNPQTGEVNYTYTLNGADTHPNGDGANDLVIHLPVVATNNDGNTATGTIVVNIIDDVPKAVNDVNGTATETHVALTGNVLTNDIQGADRIPTGPIVGGTFVGTYGTLVLAADGTYTYTLNPHDPDFIALHGGGNGTDVFTYTLKDADGDTSQATLTLQIHNNDDPVLINGLNVEGGEVTVYEKNLPDGSVHNGVVSQSGTFTVTANDGLQTLTVGGVSGENGTIVGGINVVVGGHAQGFPQSITDSLGNTLTVTGYNAETGVVSYTYTLNGADHHPAGDGANDLQGHFNVVATDTDGSSATGSLDVNVIDDVPKANNDSNPYHASESNPVLMGNVLENDVQGADRVPTGPTGTTGPIIGGTFQGIYGTLVLETDGSYTYTVNSHDPDFLALHGGGNGTEVFTYTLTDADGDTSQATLTLQIHNDDNGVTLSCLDVKGGELTVYEKNLADGSHPDNAALTQKGVFTVHAEDGLTSLKVGGIDVVLNGHAQGFPQSINTALGTLTITGYNAANGEVSYQYTLNHPDTNPNSAEHFSVVATDSDGDQAHGSLDVNIVDDKPHANNDANPYQATETNPVLMGNVLENDVQGADRIPTGPTGTTGPIVGGTFEGKYGTLVLETDGSYSYTVNPHDPDFLALHGGGNGTEVFTYTLKDADGDSSTATLTLQIHNNNDCVTLSCLDVKGGELTVYEKNLADGSHPDNAALTQKGVFTVHADDGLATLKVGGIDVVVNGHAQGFPQSISTALGTLTITGYNAANGEVSYQYTLNHPDNHPNGITEHFNVVATDTDGSQANASLDVNVVDDSPKAHNDANPYQATENNPVLMGNLLENDTQGADRIATGPTGTTGPIVGGTFEGKYGTLVLETDGSYTYTVNPHDPDFIALHGGGNGTEVFTYTLKDADGDTSKATLTLQIHNNDNGVTLDCLDVKCGELTVSEKNLPNGSHPDVGALTQSGVFTVHADDGVTSLKVGTIDVVLNGHAAGFPQSMTTSLGTLTITGYNASNGEVSYQYTLNHPDNHPNGTTEQFNVVATDTGGSHAAGTIDVNVVDDVPQAHNDANPYQATENNPVLMGNVLENDTQGADRIATGPTGTTGPIVGGTFDGKYGTLVLETDGSYTYTVNTHDPDFIALHGSGNGTEVFTYTLKDADGDTSNATLTLQIHNDHNGVTVGCPVVTPCDPNPSEHPVAVADHVITNILAPVITVPSALLVANDTDAHGDKLTATPTTFNTGWVAKGADFSAAALKTISFTGSSNIDANQLKTLDRSDFFNNSALTALVVLNGYLGATNASAANAQDLYSVTLHKGESVTLDNNKGDGHLTMQWQDTNGVFHNIADGSTFTATQDGVYHIHMSNIPDTGTHSQAAESYTLNMTVNYAGAQDVTPDVHGSYTATDGHGGSSTAHVDISYQGGNTILGTHGDDVLIGGNGNLHLHGGDGNDVLQAGTGNNELLGEGGNDLIYSGPGNDTIDGGAGNNTVSYANATAGVHVDLNVTSAQNTLGAGTDTLTHIDNIIGSHFNDTLVGNSGNNVLSGGLGNDILNGGAGDDILIGGPGNNTLTGGPGNDTFKWEQGNTGHDLVTDFNFGSDKLDLSQLLQGENSSAASLDDYLHFKVTGTGANVVTSIDVSSTAGGAPSQTIDLAGVDLASHYGVAPGAGGMIASGHDTASIINGMISDHSLKVDTV